MVLPSRCLSLVAIECTKYRCCSTSSSRAAAISVETRARQCQSRQAARGSPRGWNKRTPCGRRPIPSLCPHMADLTCALILCTFALLVAATSGVLALLPKRAGNKRLDGHGGILLARGVMEVAYKLFEPLVNLLYRLRVTPNMVTAFSLAPAVVSAGLVAKGHFGVGAMLA